MPDARSLPSPGLLCLLGLAALGCASSRAMPGRARAPLSAADSLLVSTLAAADARVVDSTALRFALASSDPAVRAFAALTAGQLRATALASDLRAAVGDRDDRVAARAAYALGLLGGATSVPVLRSALASRPAVGIEAAWALGEIGAPARKALLDFSASPSSIEPVLVEVILAEGRLRPVPVAELVPFLSDRSIAIRWASAYSLTRTRLPAAARALLAAATLEFTGRATPLLDKAGVSTYSSAASAGDVRAAIVRGLAKSVVGDSLADGARSLLHRALADADPHVRLSAVRSLSSFGAPERVSVRSAAADPDANVRVTVAESYAATGDRGPASWSALWAADTGFMFRRSLLTGATGAGVRLPALDGWSGVSDWRQRAAVAEALSSRGADSLAPGRVAALLGDADGRVRAAAVGALAASLDSTRDRSASRDRLMAALTDADPYVVAAAIDALSAVPRAGELDAMVRAYLAHPAVDALDARVSALKYVVAAWTTFPNASEVASALSSIANGPAPATPLERFVVRDVPAFATWRSKVAPPHDRRFYERVVRDVLRPAIDGRPMVATFLTARGTIRVELLGAEAPMTVENFVSLAQRGSYRNGGFHRVVPNFVAQDGDRRGDGNGGVGYAIRDELNPARYTRGALGMALSGPDTGGSQYFLTLSAQPHLDGHYSVFGRVVSGWAALDRLVQGDSLRDVTIGR